MRSEISIHQSNGRTLGNVRPEFVGKTGLTIGGSSSIGKAVGTLQLEKRAEAVVIMGKNQKKLLVAKSLQSEAFSSASGLREFLQRANCLTGFGTSGVIRAHIGATNHALLVNDVSCGHGQAESAFVVELIQLVSELQINRLEVIGKYEYQAKLSRYLQPEVGQYVKTQVEATMDRAPVPLQLRRNRNQISS